MDATATTTAELARATTATTATIRGGRCPDHAAESASAEERDAEQSLNPRPGLRCRCPQARLSGRDIRELGHRDRHPGTCGTASPVSARGRALAVLLLGPLTILGGPRLGAVAQPYRIVLLDRDGMGLYDYLVQPPLLVALVGVVFAR